MGSGLRGRGEEALCEREVTLQSSLRRAGAEVGGGLDIGKVKRVNACSRDRRAEEKQGMGWARRSGTYLLTGLVAGRKSQPMWECQKCIRKL